MMVEEKADNKKGCEGKYGDSLVHALFYKRVLNFTVVPFGVSEGGERVYFVKWGVYYEREQTEEEVKMLFSKFKGANIAVVLGKPSGIIAIDIDKKEIPEYLERIITWVAITRRGYHYFFKHPGGEEKVRSMRLEEGVELKGDNSLLTLPRSYHHKDEMFRYEWLIPPMKNIKKKIFNELADFEVVRNKLAVYYVRKDEPEAIRELYKGVPEGKRNISMTRLAGSLFYDRLEYEEVLSILLVVNKNNNPPLPEKEVISIVKSIYEKDVKRRRLFDEIKEKFCEFVSTNGIKDGLLEHVKKIKEEAKRSGLNEKEIDLLLRRISIYDVYKAMQKHSIQKHLR